MAHKGYLAFVLLASMAACSDGAAPGDMIAPTPLLSGMYSATTAVAAQAAQAEALGEAREHAEVSAWDPVVTAIAPTAPAGTVLTLVDATFVGDAAGASPLSLRGSIMAAIERARAAPGDMIVQKASQETVEKALINAQHLAWVNEIRGAVVESEAGEWARSRERWDRAVVYFNGLASSYATRGAGELAGVWGPGNSRLSDENLLQRMSALLVSGRQHIDARAADAFADTAGQAEVYGNKYFFLSAVNYGDVYATRAASMMDLEYPRAEGRALFESVAILWGARSTDPAMVAALMSARARWERGAPMGPTRTSVLNDCGRIYALATGAWTSRYATASARERIVIRGRVRGMVDLLDEALAYAQQDVTDLRAKITRAEALSAANDHVGAAALLEEVRAAVESVSRAGG
jgi:hypothetical protein